jgi:hypothetical protein
MVLFVLTVLPCPVASSAQGLDITTPSAVKGTIGFCPNRLWKDKHIQSCQIVEATQDDKALAVAALDALNRLVKSDQFKTAVLAADFDPAQIKQCKSQDSCGPQLTKAKVYELMVSNSPQTINMIYYLHHWPDEGNQGFEYPTPPDTVFGNDEKIKGDEGFLASLMLHEWMHILGFRHDNRKTRCHSVPYEMNAIYTMLSHSPQLNLAPSDSGCLAKQ